MNSEPLVSLFSGYYDGAAAILTYERRWISPLAFPLVPWLVFFDILYAPLITAHKALVCFCADIISLGANITSPTATIETHGGKPLVPRHGLLQALQSYHGKQRIRCLGEAGRSEQRRHQKKVSLRLQRQAREPNLDAYS